jgi:WD40-like Beta Propeller Repeat
VPYPRPQLLQWSADGRRLALVTADKLVVFARRRPAIRFMRGTTSAAFAPSGHALAVVQRGSLLLFDADDLRAKPKRLFAGAGLLGDVVWSPDGRWLLTTWPGADQWLFVRSSGGKLLAYSHIAEQFGGGTFPSLSGWCCR